MVDGSTSHPSSRSPASVLPRKRDPAYVAMVVVFLFELVSPATRRLGCRRRSRASGQRDRLRDRRSDECSRTALVARGGGDGSGRHEDLARAGGPWQVRRRRRRATARRKEDVRLRACRSPTVSACRAKTERGCAPGLKPIFRLYPGLGPLLSCCSPPGFTKLLPSAWNAMVICFGPARHRSGSLSHHTAGLGVPTAGAFGSAPVTWQRKPIWYMLSWAA